MNTKEILLTEIQNLDKREDRFGWWNYRAAYFVAFLALFGSITTIFLIVFDANKILTAIIAAIPALAISFTKIFNFERRAVYHWRKSKKLRGLLRQLKYEDEDIKAVSRAFTRIDVETLNEWVMFDVSSMRKGNIEASD